MKKNNVSFTFYDYKKSGISTAKLSEWCKQVGWESLVNKQGATWRQLHEAVKKAVVNEKAAIALMREKTSIIKRPLIEKND